MPAQQAGIAHIKVSEKHKHPKKKWVKTLDKFLIFIALAGPLVTIPQIIKIFSEQNASGLSLITWGLFLMVNIPWIVYGYVHKEKPVFISSTFYFITNIVVVIGILTYS